MTHNRRIPLISGDEYDFLTRFRRYLCPKVKRLHLARVKRGYRRRLRHTLKLELKAAQRENLKIVQHKGHDDESKTNQRP